MMTFEQFGSAHGLILRNAIPDWVKHSCPTENKPHKRNGRYKFDGNFGWVRAWDGDAETHYFTPEVSGAKPDPLVRARVMRRQTEERDALVHDQNVAAERARARIERCKVGFHPYFGKKGLYDGMGLVDPQVVTIEGIECTDCLLVPMRDWNTGDILSAQWINDDGQKKFMPGGRTKGAVHVLGPRSASVTWLCEGYATGWTVAAAVKTMYRQDRVVVCFSAGNLKFVAERMGGERRVVADNDLPDKYGRQAGQDAAAATGLAWTMPPTEATDMNDLGGAESLRAVVKLMRAIL